MTNPNVSKLEKIFLKAGAILYEEWQNQAIQHYNRIVDTVGTHLSQTIYVELEMIKSYNEWRSERK